MPPARALGQDDAAGLYQKWRHGIRIKRKEAGSMPWVEGGCDIGAAVS